jgi:hypothetical protein
VVLGQADDFGRSALRHRQLDRAELAGKHLGARVARTHRHAQLLAEVEDSAVEPVELFVLLTGARPDGDEGRQQTAQAMHVLVHLQQTDVARQLGVRPPIDRDLGDRRCLQGSRDQWHVLGLAVRFSILDSVVETPGLRAPPTGRRDAPVPASAAGPRQMPRRARARRQLRRHRPRPPRFQR